jgi:hypothetical protein
MPPPSANNSEKRTRGRPRKPAPFDWLRDPPEWIKWLGIDNLQNEEVRKASKEIGEYHRRESVSDSVRAAYSEGRNTANHDRRMRKQKLLAEIFANHSSLIAQSKLSASAVANSLAHKGKTYGLSASTIRRHVAYIRKKLAKPNRQ